MVMAARGVISQAQISIAGVTGIMTGILTGRSIMTGITGDVKLVFIAVELDCYVYNWCIHTPSSDIQQGWNAGINIPLHWVLLRHFINLFITWSYNSCVRQSNFVYTSSLLIFSVYTSQSYSLFLCLYQSFINLFIGYTSAPVEVSVWLGGTTQKSVYGASCVQDAVQVE